MRKLIFCLALVLAGCGSTDSDSGEIFGGIGPANHVPVISNLSLSPNGATYMEGDGTVVVTAYIDVADAGRDIQTLLIQLPDGTLVQADQDVNSETGTLTVQFEVPTTVAGVFNIEFWLVDQNGDSSAHQKAEFVTIEWTSRLRVPLPLLDVVWDGQVFIAVGYGGTILTSVDGIDWMARKSVSDDVLVAVVAVGSEFYAVGGAGVLLSTDHGETWTVIGRPDFFIGTAVAASSSQIVALGTVPDLGIPLITVSEDSGDTWETWDVSWSTGDLIYRDGLFVTPSGPGVRVSTDGKQWSEIVVDDVNTALNEVVVHDDSQFFVVGDDGTVFSSFDAFNWTELSAPLADVYFKGAAWNGTRLILAGGVYSYQDRHDGTYRPIGISSSDGGGSWDTFGIDSSYVSHGIAWGNGRFVSVGTMVVSDEGAIYTTD